MIAPIPIGDLLAAEDFDRRRQRAARRHEELLLASDPSKGEIRTVREHPAVRALAEELERCGYGLRVLPASYAWDPSDRTRPSAFVLEENPWVLCLGVTRNASIPQVVRAGASALALARGFPTPDSEPQRRVAAMIRESFALRFAGQADPEYLRRRFRHLLGRAVEQPVVSKRQLVDGSLAAWALLAASDASTGKRLLMQLEEVSPELGARASRLLEASGTAPRTGAEARRLTSVLSAVLAV